MVAWCEECEECDAGDPLSWGGRDDYNGVGVPPPDLGGGGRIVFMYGSYTKR